MEDPRTALKDALKAAMKSKDTVARNTIRNLNAAIKQVEVDEQKEVSGNEVVDIIVKQVKMLRESIAEKEAADRADLAEEDKAQLVVMERFLPQQLTEEEIEKIVADTIEKVGAASMKDMGKVMGALMAQVKGKADGKVVSNTVRKQLGQ